LLLGETVIALGNPFGLGGSVSRGILSSKNRRPVTGDGRPAAAAHPADFEQ
jgi:S1-C subfamily serine protease